MKKRRRFGRGLLFTLGALLVALLLLLYSESGLRLAVSLLTEILLKPLSVAEVEGRLAGPFTLSGIEYTDKDRHLTLEKLTMDWEPASLLTDTFHIRTLKLGGFNYKQEKSDTEKQAEAFTLPQIHFPLKLIVDEASIDGIILNLPERPEPLSITQLALKAKTRRDTLLLHSLTLSSDWLAFDVKGELQPQRDYHIDLMTSWKVPQPGKSPWQGQGTLKGNLKALNLQQNLNSPFNAAVNLKASDLVGELKWKGTLEVPHLESTQLPFSVSPAFSVGGTLNADGDIDSFKSATVFSGKVETIGAINGNLEASYADRHLQLNRVVLRRQQDNALIEAQGEIELTTPLRYQFETRWESLSWPHKMPAIQSDSGRLTSHGEDAQFHFDGEFLLRGPQVPRGKWRLRGNGDSKAIRISSLEGKLLNGTVTLDGTVNLQPRIQWQANLKGRDLNPEVKWPGWPGQLALNATFKGRLPQRGLVMDVDLSSVSGSLRDRKLQGHSQASWDSGDASLQALDMKIGSAHLQAKGKLSDEVAFEWQLNAAALSDLFPESQGSLNAQGKVSGPRETPAYTVMVEGKAISFMNYRAEQVLADVDLDRQEDNPSRIQLQLKQLKLPGLHQQSVTLNLQGPLSSHKLSLSSRSEYQAITLNASAEYKAERWAGTILNLQIDDTKLGLWKLAQETPYSLSSTALNLEEFCLRHNNANLCGGMDWARGAGVNAGLRSSDFPLQLFAPYLPQQIGIEGELDAEAKLAIAPEQPPNITARLNIGEGHFRLLHPETESEVMSLPFSRVDVQLDTAPQARIDGALTLTLNEQDNIKLNVQTSMAQGWPDSFRQQPLTGRLRLSLQELDFLSGLLPEVQNVHGRVDADVSMSGTLMSPQLRGDARLEQGELEVSRAGLRLSDVQLMASGDNTRTMKITGKAQSGDGDLTLNGQLLPSTKGPWSLELAMVGKNFEVANIPEARMQVSPDLKIRIVGREIHLDGNMDIPYARLEPRDLRLATKTSDDVVIVGQEEVQAEREIWRIHTRVRMTAADSIRFIGYGFDGRIGGELLLIDEPGSVTRGRGVLHVVPNSNYEAFGTKLSIERGRLNFADSPVDNPNLDIKASRTIGDVIAGVNVSGTAKSPVLTLYSDPPMDQADILSYLTLGHPVSAASQSEGEALAGAANSAGLVGGNYLAGYLGRQFGLEEARVETRQDSQSPWVVVGKYLSPKLYIRYGVGVYEDAYSVIVRYQLSKHWQVQGEGGLNSGADIIYTFERP